MSEKNTPEDIQEILEAIDKVEEYSTFLRSKFEYVKNKQSYYDLIACDVRHHIELTDQDAIGLIKDAVKLKEALRMARKYRDLSSYIAEFIKQNKPTDLYRNFKKNQEEPKQLNLKILNLDDFKARKSA